MTPTKKPKRTRPVPRCKDCGNELERMPNKALRCGTCRWVQGADGQVRYY